MSRLCALALLTFVCGSLLAGDDHSAADKKALAPLQLFVGSWKGTGTPKTGGKEAWGEEADGQWEFKDGHAAIVIAITGGKYYAAARLEPGDKEGSFVFTGTLPENKGSEKYTGSTVKGGDLELLPAAPAEGRPEKIIIGTLAKGNRMVLTYYKKNGDTFAPLAEVGWTRKGSGFGKDPNAKECVVTGGLGTIAVSYKGQTYYVCCGGCKSEFNENPEKVLAEYKKRKEDEKAQAPK